ncbi:hypothetical protein HDV06_003730 [Boothiomyces sp. JEL0866]|nr:hypothetical protein HDV06_003730 [Boothiomyces sp. JEL0866]
MSQPHTPQNQGIVERANGSLKRILFKLMYDNKRIPWSDHLQDIEDVYNTSVNRITGKTPNELYFGNAQQHAKNYDKQVAQKRKAFKNISQTLSLNDKVRIENRIKTKPKGLSLWSKEIYRIVKIIRRNGVTNTDRYKLQDSNERLMHNTYSLSSLLKI